jgi:perosamine synthetase
MYKIPLSKPSYLPYIDEVLSATEKVLRSGHIAMGPIIEEFEQHIADYCGTKYAIAVSSGTAGLFLCLKSIGIGPGDEVITTPFSFIASSNVIVHVGATPVFIDIDRSTYNLSVPSLIRTQLSDKVKAILPVDTFANPFDTNRIHGLPIILDSCESFGNKMDRPFDAAVYAFYPNKALTTGEGGIIVTDNQDIAEYCQAMRNQGRKKGDQWLDSSMIGWNFRMTDLQAAIGLVQFNHWDEIKRKRQWVALQYTAELSELFCSGLVNWQEYTTNDVCPFVFTIEVPNRDKVMRYLLDHGIEVKPYFPCIHLQKPYRDMGYREGMFPVAEEVASRTLALPYWSDMSEDEVVEVCRVLKDALEET